MDCATPPHGQFADAEKKACCTPSAGARTATIPVGATASAGADPAVRMIELPGGSFLMGTEDPQAFPQDGEGPVREVELKPFWIDRYPVTNQLFAQFVHDTGYTTEAERFGWSFVFWRLIPKALYSRIVRDTVAAAPWWCQVPGTNWRSPEGPGSNIDSRANHPVVHVSWNDAVRFCAWSGQRLPTEAEWEYAARGGLVQKIHPWGDKLRPGGKHLCNIWQGDFPQEDTGEDGYRGTCPVDAFPPNGYGLYSVTGNTWEWCSDWFSSSFHRAGPRDNPQGPPTGEARVIKGGSFLCHHSYCNRYRVAARSSNTPDSTTSHMSFRCVGDI
jgi:formylglycine-generating enzyme